MYWHSYLRRSVFVAGLIAMFWLWLMFEILFFSFRRLNFIAIPFSELIIIVLGLLIIQLFRYIYVVKKRYDLIVKLEFKGFSLSLNKGLIIVFLIFIFSFLITIGSAVWINIYLKS